MNFKNITNSTTTSLIQNTLTNTLRTYFAISNPNNLKLQKWTPNEDNKLLNIIKEKGPKNWKMIAEYFTNKSPLQCILRWKKITNNCNNNWSDEQIEKLKELVSNEGTNSWIEIAKQMNGKSPKSCKQKWKLISQEEETWTNLDEAYLLIAVNSYGTCWSKISKLFPTHLETSVKNRFYSILRKTAYAKLNNENSDSDKIIVKQFKLIELLIFLPSALTDYKQIIGENVFDSLSQQFQISENRKCESDIISFKTSNVNNQINICSECKNKLKHIIKKNILANMLKKNFSEFGKTSDEMMEINSLEKLKNTSQKIEKLKRILCDVNKNILNIN